jgi:hypothetical protein
MSAVARRGVARRAAIARWVGERFAASSFRGPGLPGGEIVDAGLANLADGRVTTEGPAEGESSKGKRGDDEGQRHGDEADDEDGAWVDGMVLAVGDRGSGRGRRLVGRLDLEPVGFGGRLALVHANLEA